MPRWLRIVLCVLLALVAMPHLIEARLLPEGAWVWLAMGVPLVAMRGWRGEGAPEWVRPQRRSRFRLLASATSGKVARRIWYGQSRANAAFAGWLFVQTALVIVGAGVAVGYGHLTAVLATPVWSDIVYDVEAVERIAAMWAVGVVGLGIGAIVSGLQAGRRGCIGSCAP